MQHRAWQPGTIVEFEAFDDTHGAQRTAAVFNK